MRSIAIAVLVAAASLTVLSLVGLVVMALMCSDPLTSTQSAVLQVLHAGWMSGSAVIFTSLGTIVGTSGRLYKNAHTINDEAPDS